MQGKKYIKKNTKENIVRKKVFIIYIFSTKCEIREVKIIEFYVRENIKYIFFSLKFSYIVKTKEMRMVMADQ